MSEPSKETIEGLIEFHMDAGMHHNKAQLTVDALTELLEARETIAEMQASTRHLIETLHESEHEYNALASAVRERVGYYRKCAPRVGNPICKEWINSIADELDVLVTDTPEKENADV